MNTVPVCSEEEETTLGNLVLTLKTQYSIIKVRIL